MTEWLYFLLSAIFGVVVLACQIINALLVARSEVRLQKAIADMRAWIEGRFVDKDLCRAHGDAVSTEVKTLRDLILQRRGA
jgi:hypothetical protein